MLHLFTQKLYNIYRYLDKWLGWAFPTVFLLAMLFVIYQITTYSLMRHTDRVDEQFVARRRKAKLNAFTFKPNITPSDTPIARNRTITPILPVSNDTVRTEVDSLLPLKAE